MQRPPDDVLDRLAERGRTVEGDVSPVNFDELAPVGDQAPARGRRRAAAAAAVLVLGVGGLVVVAQRQVGAPTTDMDPATPPSSASEIDALPTARDSLPTNQASNTSPPPVSDTGVPPPLSGDPGWSDAQRFLMDAQFQVSPDEFADIVAANDLRSRECLREQGLDIPAFEPGRQQALVAHWTRSTTRQLLYWTAEGRRTLRANGYLALRGERVDTEFGYIVDDLDEVNLYPHFPTPIPPACYPAATSVTYGGSAEVWSESQFFERLLESEEWRPVSWRFGDLPGTELVYADSVACMVDRGWTEWGQLGAPYQALFYEGEQRSDDAVRIAIDDADCLDQVGATEVFLSASEARVTEFREEFADELDVIEGERSDALSDAYAVLRAAGLDPLSD